MIYVQWHIQKGYSIEEQLEKDGLNFDSFKIIEKSTNETVSNKIKRDIISNLCKQIRKDFLAAERSIDISAIKHGTYCIALGAGFEYSYEKRQSRVLYIGSGSIYNRIKRHLTQSLFDFAQAMNKLPLRFIIADFTELEDSNQVCRQLEQALIDKFREDIDDSLPLLNKKNAVRRDKSYTFCKGWDLPIQLDRGRSTKQTNWLIKLKKPTGWKGTLS
jgi:hypothetical protein